MALTLQDAGVQVSLLPLGFAAVSTGAIRLVGGGWRGPTLASAAIVIGALGAGLILLGLPAFPPQTSLQRLLYVIAVSLFLGTVLDLRRPRDWVLSVLIVLWGAAAVAWIAEPRLRDADDLALARVGILYVATLLVLFRLQERLSAGLVPSIMTFSAALGIGGVSVIGGAVAAGQMAFALAAATFGFMLWNWPVVRYPFGLSALFAGAGALPLLAGHSLLYADANPAALALILLVFLADAPARWAEGRRQARTVAPGYLMLLSLLPVAAALLVAYADRHGIRHLW
jgi:hypothetical protein